MLNDLAKSKKEFVAELNYDELTPHFDKAIAEYRKKATYPGFRKGKVPLNMIKKLFGDSLEHTALEDIANDIFRNYIIDNKIEIIGKGVITDLDYKPKENLKFKINFEIFPEINIENYKGIELKKTKYVIDDSLITEEIQYHKFRNATQELDGIALDDNYIITVDLQNLDETGNFLIGQSQKDLQVYLGNPEIYPEFRDAFKGIKEGEVKIIDSKNADGGLKKVQITCKKVEKIIYPEMDEKFFHKVTGKESIKSEEEFKTEIKNELTRIYDGIADRKLRADVVNEIIKLNEIDVPDIYVETILNSIAEDYLKQFEKKKLPQDFNIDEFKKERKVDAILQGKWFLIKDKLVEIENISVEESDIKKIADENFARYNIPADKLFEAYKDNEDLKNKILNDKVIDLIIENAKIDVTIEIKKKENADEDIVS